MTTMTARELDATYQYVIGEQVVRDAARLLMAEAQEELVVSGWYWRMRPGYRRSILELEGLGAEIWAGVDAKQYIDEQREELGERRVVPPALSDPKERRRRLATLVEWLKSNPLAAGAPRMTREEFHERR